MARSQNLKLVAPQAAPDRTVVDGALGGVGLDWSRVPSELADRSLAEWEHLATTFAGDPARFREGDRSAVVNYCLAVEAAALAAAALREHGALVPGRSESDRGRPVRSPAHAIWRDASHQVRQWAEVLGLTPSSRARLNLPEPPAAGDDNPFAP